MKVYHRRSEDRGLSAMDWLHSYHSFSFADYFDPQFMGYRSLRVINEDTFQPKTGFPTHGHRDMEIISYLIRGALEHKDSTGGYGVLRRGEVQHMTAGTGVSHSEYNASADDVVYFLQIWIQPEATGLTPGYEQKPFPDEAKRNRLCLIAAPDGSDGVLTIRQDLRLFASLLDGGARVSHPLAAGRGVWLQLISGTLEVNGIVIAKGDGLAVEDVDELSISAESDAEFLLFDIA